MPLLDHAPAPLGAVRRVRVWYALLVFIIVIFGVRLFYVQVIRYDHFKKAALSDQLKQYEIPATRGVIKAHDGDNIVPIVLNQKLYTLYADPVYIKDPVKAAAAVEKIIGGSAGDYADAMQAKNTRYVVLAKKLPEAQSKKIIALKIPGLGTQEQDYRIYPQGSLAAQVLGFVDHDGQGQYGVEQALNDKLAGKPGQLKAITDASGVPLAASSGNVVTRPTPGDNVVLTLDMAMQQQLEAILKQGKVAAKAEAVSALIMDPNSGAIKAMANYPSYNPAEYYKAADASVYKNAAVDHPIEPGSIMKVLTTAAALNQGVINANSSFYDPGHWRIDGFNITDVEEDGGPGQRSIADILQLSLNTGATWELMQMGGGEINGRARNAWHDYMVNHYMFGRPTGVTQGYEASGYVPSPKDNGAGINLTYANTSFGQAMTATPVQMAAAMSAALNGGTYYQPRLIDQIINPNGKISAKNPHIVKKNVVSERVSRDLIGLMQYMIEHHYFKQPFDLKRYSVGGKTGTAQVANPNGGYYENIFNGTYAGFVGGDSAQYVIIVYVFHPNVDYFAGAAAAQPIFGDLAHMLINNGYVTPKSR